MVGLSPHLILRTARADAIHDETENMGWTGNVLFDRLAGTTIYTCTAGEVRENTVGESLILESPPN